MRRGLLLCVCLAVAMLLVTLLAAPADAVRTTAECLDLGFDKDVVRCTACEKLFMVTQSTALQHECADCCVATEEDAAASSATYPAARIEARGLRRALEATSMGALAMFYRTYVNEPYYEHLTFVEKYTAIYPQMVLVDAEGKDALTWRIAGWSPETLHEFLSKKILVEEAAD